MNVYIPLLTLAGLAALFAIFSVSMATLTGPKRYNRAKVDAYVYLAESIRAWPDQRQLAGTIAGNGWTDVRHRNLTGGIVALHRAVR